MTDRDLRGAKLNPRNLTARADRIVRGNPVTTRPDSGVENCFPGLEFDHRNLDKVVFPGLQFEFHNDRGTILRDIDGERFPSRDFYSRNDLERGVFLLAILGQFPLRGRSSTGSRQHLEMFTNVAALDAWRLVHDLDPGDLAVAVADEATLRRAREGDAGALRQNLAAAMARRESRRERLSGLGAVGLFFGERARFLNADGVIAPALVEAGDLTRSLCSPWQYDFADCGCFYWASNKPDLVSSDAQPKQILNYQRRERTESSDAATRGDEWLVVRDGRTVNVWDAEGTVRHAEMISAWRGLPFVVGTRETDRFTPAAKRSRPGHLSREEIVRRLKKLATVEHALAVEYLYAFYSLELPRQRPATADSKEARVFTAGEQVFQVAVDEMRHLRWVNEILLQLGEEPVLERAKIIGESWSPEEPGFEKPYELVPLTADQLQWFIDVEKASEKDEGDNHTIDGMYTRILDSIQNGGEFDAEEAERLGHYVKVIIDEGTDHWRRFLTAQEALQGIDEKDYLVVRSGPAEQPSGTPEGELQAVVDASYRVVLRALQFVFDAAADRRAALLEAARRAMFNMDDAARELAARGIGALFLEEPEQPASALDTTFFALSAGPSRSEALELSALEVGAPLRALLPRLEAIGEQEAALAQRLNRRLDELTAGLQAAMAGEV